MLNRLEQLTVDSHQVTLMDCFALGPSISLVREQDVFHVIESMGNDYAEFAYLQRPACEGKLLLDKLQEEMKLASISEHVDQHARTLISTWCRQDQLYHKEFLRDVLRAWNIDTKLVVEPGIRDDFSTVSRQLERRLELLRKHLPELEKKMASTITELTHARDRWKEQLANIQRIKEIYEQMETENEQHAKRIQELLAKKRRLEVRMRYKEVGGSKFQRDNVRPAGTMTFAAAPRTETIKINLGTLGVVRMSLYDDSEVDSKGVAGWSSGIKMLQSHVQLRKATGHHLQRKGQAAAAHIAPVLDLNTRTKDRISAEDMPPIPLYVARGGASLLGGDWFLKDEYDPSYPNEYDRLVKQLRRESRKEKRSAPSDSSSNSAGDSPTNSGGSSDRASAPKRQSAMIAPPPSLTASDPPARALSPPAPHQQGAVSVASNMGCSSVAAKIMARMGFKAGQGLGKSEQGISSALAVEKTSHRGGKIVDMSSAQAAAAAAAMTDMPPPLMAPPGLPSASTDSQALLDNGLMGPPPPGGLMGPPPPPGPSSGAIQPAAEEQSITEILKNPTKVVLLRNMVGPGEVDEELEPETKEECGRYGEVVKCVIHELPGPGVSPEEAVRIFVEYKNLAHAIKAVVDLNGRFFGGRVVRAGFYEQDKFNRLELV
ncbi:splicing factor 45-like isoform X3 [Varroa destructor]|nr:splicing factor 45-like isoform X3 [Varroa destructor]XP_022673013.1 splicing factor 45-like isoform X3 [Varroa destructor]